MNFFHDRMYRVPYENFLKILGVFLMGTINNRKRKIEFKSSKSNDYWGFIPWTTFNICKAFEWNNNLLRIQFFLEAKDFWCSIMIIWSIFFYVFLILVNRLPNIIHWLLKLGDLIKGSESLRYIFNYWHYCLE